MTFTIQAATEYGIGNGINGTGRRSKIHGFYVVDTRSNRAVRAFNGKCANDAAARKQAEEWAVKCENMLANGYIR